jgi:hypothetical protein
MMGWRNKCNKNHLEVKQFINKLFRFYSPFQKSLKVIPPKHHWYFIAYKYFNKCIENHNQLEPPNSTLYYSVGGICPELKQSYIHWSLINLTFWFRLLISSILFNDWSSKTFSCNWCYFPVSPHIHPQRQWVISEMIGFCFLLPS